jgi:hypothetical protein
MGLDQPDVYGVARRAALQNVAEWIEPSVRADREKMKKEVAHLASPIPASDRPRDPLGPAIEQNHLEQ